MADTRFKPTPLAERFWTKVDMSGGPDACWPWLGGRISTGYGQVWVNGETRQATHAAVFLSTGMWPKRGRRLAERDAVRHTCDNPPCVNPAHLMVDRERQVRGERHHSALLTEDDVLHIRAMKALGVSGAALARELGATKEAVNCAARGKTWKHVS